MPSVPPVRRHMWRPMVFTATIVLALAAVPATQAHDTSTEFVTRSGSQLILAGQPYTFTGINLYNANSDGWCRDALTDTEFETALDNAGLGGESHGVLRAWFFQTLATDKGTRARDWTRFDRTIAIAKVKGLQGHRHARRPVGRVRHGRDADVLVQDGGLVHRRVHRAGSRHGGGRLRARLAVLPRLGGRGGRPLR